MNIFGVFAEFSPLKALDRDAWFFWLTLWHGLTRHVQRTYLWPFLPWEGRTTAADQYKLGWTISSEGIPPEVSEMKKPEEALLRGL